MRILDALDRYVLHLRSCDRSHHTIAQATRHVRTLASWLVDEGRHDDIAAIDHETIAAFLVSSAATRRPDGTPKKATSTNALRSSIRNFFGYLHRAGDIDADPSRLVRRARCSPPPPRALTDDERERLLRVLDQAESQVEHRDRVLFLLMIYTGVRVGSTVSLDIEDVDLNAGHLHLRRVKGGGADRVVIPDRLAPVLRELLGDRTTGPLFPGRRGRLTTRHVARRFGSWLSRAEISRPASPHSLRHSFATRLLARTGDLRLVQTALTHRSIASTTIYACVEDARLRAAVNA